MIAGYLAAAACLGYLFCEYTYLARYSLARKSGHKYYLPVLVSGTGFTLVGMLIHFTFVNRQIFNTNYTPSITEFVLILVFSIAILPIAIASINWWYTKEEALRKVASNDLDSLILDACFDEALVQVVLRNNKVYVGQVYEAFEPDGDNSHLTLIPLHSGHRDSDFILRLTHTYNDIDDVVQNREHQRYSDYRLVIPKNEIVTCHRFHVSIHNQVMEDLAMGLVD